ncbi:TetR/AcrR family transcriptional regulator [Streptomyces roseus]|uniref:TetR family transcriptional regulator n=1 Tax=Streptomyces roseus TaxID=66430 RepID=A0A0J7AAK9_9ACTN|nr:TetR/AcrR family transcriptional regulator C-terminal domain-containing protein [Streptomyces roseus]KMO94326.1 TetR family transcriptional regulator [Streptomyces roseus]
MATKARRTERREEPLSRERIVEAAIGILDAVGEGGLTFRVLAERLATGPGAIYWHVSGKEELLGAATEVVVTGTVLGGAGGASPQEVIRDLALRLFDAIDAHPWIGGQLARSPGQSPTLQVFERLGRQVQALGVPRPARFTAASTLLSYILGVAGQNAANAHGQESEQDRTEFLDGVSAAWANLDPDAYPFTRDVAEQLREHDDRAEFLAGIDLVLAGIAASHAG